MRKNMNLFCQTTTMHAPMSSYETFVSGRSINIGICLDPRIDNEHLLFKDRNEYCRFREELIDTKKTIQYRNYNLKPREARMGWGACGVISKSQKLPKPDQRTPDTTEDYPYLIIPFAENPNEGVIIFSPYCSHEPTTNMGGMGIRNHGKKNDGFHGYTFSGGEVTALDPTKKIREVTNEMEWGKHT